MGGDNSMLSGTKIPAITTEQMAEVDRLMIQIYGIALIQMMENAGKNLAELARSWLGGIVLCKRVIVLCGAGNNGGGGMVAARHLGNWGADVQVALAANPEKLKDVPEKQWRILQAMGVAKNHSLDASEQPDLILDALIGYGLTGDPRGKAAELIERMNDSGTPIISLDVPSGLDATSGLPGNPCVRAAATLTLALPKTGLFAPGAKPYVGDLFIADISIPPSLYRQMGLAVPLLFTSNSIRQIDN